MRVATRLRLRLTAIRTKEDLDRALEVLEKVGREFGALGNSSETYIQALVA